MNSTQMIQELRSVIGKILDASEPDGNGESVVPTELIEDAREIAFGVRGEE